MKKLSLNGSTVDLSELGQLAGFTAPVQITVGVQKLCEAHGGWYGQPNFIRVWDVLLAARKAFRQKKKSMDHHVEAVSKLSVVEFTVHPQDEPGFQGIDLWLVFSVNEGFTIMLPSEG